MFEADLLISMLLMSMLFLRHIMVYKDRNKINYTPVVLGIGIIAGLMHFVTLGDSEGWLLALRESMLTIIVGVVLSAIMSVMSQTQNAVNLHYDHIRMQTIQDEVQWLKDSFNDVSNRLGHLTQMESSTHQQLKDVLKEEIDALNMIQGNQKLFVQKIEAMIAKQQLSLEKFEDFTLTELPSLDNIIHRHIDLLRISEQDHFNQLKTTIKNSTEERKTLQEELSLIKQGLDKIHKSHSMDGIIAAFEHEFSRIIHEFSRQIRTLGSKSESIVTKLLENEKILVGSREQSELIMQQMVLSSNQMLDISHSAKELGSSLKPIGTLFESAEALIKEFVMAKSKLHELIVTLESYEKQEHRALRENLENVAHEAIAQMQLLTQKITQHEVPHISPQDVVDLTHKVKLHQSYSGE